MSKNQLILIRGIPGSGKTTLARELAASDACGYVRHFEADQYFVGDDGVYRWDPKKLKEAHKTCQESTRMWLKTDSQLRVTVIVSNTFTTIHELRPYFDMANECGIIPRVYLAQGNFKSIHDVPEETIERMKSRFQYDISALYEEFGM